MIAPDANLLIYAYNPLAPLHRPSLAWLEDTLSSDEPVGIPVYCIQAFLRFSTHPKHTPNPFRFEEAAAVVNSWLSIPSVQVLETSPRHWSILQELSRQVRIRGAEVTDAAIAALALEHGAVVHTNDRDFARFPGLRWKNPLMK